MASAPAQHAAQENSSTATVSASLAIVEQLQLQMEEAVGGQEDPCCLEIILDNEHGIRE
jgi:hypothetical protein